MAWGPKWQFQSWTLNLEAPALPVSVWKEAWCLEAGGEVGRAGVSRLGGHWEGAWRTEGSGVGQGLREGADEKAVWVGEQTARLVLRAGGTRLTGGQSSGTVHCYGLVSQVASSFVDSSRERDPAQGACVCR